MAKGVSQQTDDALLVFKMKMECHKLTDRELKIVISTVRTMLLERQQSRAAKKYLKG